MQATLEVPKIFANIDGALDWEPQPLLVSGAAGCLAPGNNENGRSLLPRAKPPTV